jgi:hypothetical protein
MRVIIILLALIVPAFAQSSAQLSLINQALSQKLYEEVTASIQLKMQLIEAQARIKELEEKLEQQKINPKMGSKGPE